MKCTIYRWRWALPFAAALAWNTSSATAQQPLAAADLIKPIEAAPLEAVPLEAVPLAPSSEAVPGTVEQDSPSAQAPSEIATGQPTPALKKTPIEHASQGARPAIDEDQPRELIKERFGNGALRVEREMIQDAEGNFVHHGLYREYDLKGTLIVEGEYNRGRREGIWQRMHAPSESPLFQTAPYKEFKGPYLSQVEYADGLFHGKWLIADVQQRKISEISFSRGERHGESAWFYPSGKPMTKINYEKGRVHGDVVKWGADSTVLMKEQFQNGRQVATKIEYHDKNLKRREISYLNAMLYARIPDDWDKAQLAVFEARGQDEKHGPFKTWHPTGNLARQGEFRYNLPVGKINYWYSNGQPQTEGTYSDGRPSGVWTWYHPNGQKAIVGEYRDGVAIGDWTWWNADGKVARKADFSRQHPGPVVQGPPQVDQPREASIRIELVEPGLIQR